MTQVSYAFYTDPSGEGFKGETTYAGKSDGLERKYFGASLTAAEKMVDNARTQGKNYRLDKITYDHAYHGSSELRCKTQTLKLWPFKN